MVGGRLQKIQRDFIWVVRSVTEKKIQFVNWGTVNGESKGWFGHYEGDGS